MSRKKRYNRKYTPPQGSRVTPLNSQALAAQISAVQNSPMYKGTDAFSPGMPIAPTQGVTLVDGPRQYSYPFGYNIASEPRSSEQTPFDTLRTLAATYDGYMLCEQVWLDMVSRLEIDIAPTQEALDATKGDATVYAKPIAAYKAFFEYPDRDNGLDMKSWLRMAVRETLQIDALTIYPRLNRAGGLYSLEIVDGTTVKPLIDDRGRRPAPPFPAYQQFWHGIPLGWYTSDEMLYFRETQRADSVYGMGRVERIIMRVNQALRKQTKDMGMFTDGNVPPGILTLPQTNGDWTADKILMFQQMWDGVLSGNDAQRARIKVVPPGAVYTSVHNQDISSQFDMFLLNVTAACCGLTMAELGFTENVNKSSGDSQENVVYRRTIRPLMQRYADLFNLILRKYFNEYRFIFSFKGFEEAEDLQSQAETYAMLVKSGLITNTNAARLLHLPPVEDELPPFVLTATGPVFLKKAYDDAMSGVGTPSAAQPTALTQQEAPAPFTEPSADKADIDEELDDEKEISADMRRWRSVALKDMKQGKTIRTFESHYIPDDIQRMVLAGLQQCKTVDDVRNVFAALKASAVA